MMMPLGCPLCGSKKVSPGRDECPNCRRVVSPEHVCECERCGMTTPMIDIPLCGDQSTPATLAKARADHFKKQHATTEGCLAAVVKVLHRERGRTTILDGMLQRLRGKCGIRPEDMR